MASVQFLPTFIIPTLTEIVAGVPLAVEPGPYNRAAFVDFLKLSHCSENLAFILDVDKYTARFNVLENVPFLDDEAILENHKLERLWRHIYNTYILRTSPKEVNAPGKLLTRFLELMLPEPKELQLLRKAVFELLSANYNDFIASTRESHGHGHHAMRRGLEAVAPETIPMAETGLLSPETIFHTTSPDLLVQWEKTLDIYELLKLASSCESGATPSRANSAGTVSTRPSSRGSSIGSVFESLRDSTSGWRKTVKKLRPRRASSEKPPGENPAF